MIGSMGGMELDASNNRDWPGSGGMVGGVTPTSRNYSWALGVGEKYNTFTPSPMNILPPIIDDGCVYCRDPEFPSPLPDYPSDPGYPGGGGGPLPAPVPTPTPTPSPTPTPDPVPTNDPPGGPVVGGTPLPTDPLPGTVGSLIERLLEGIGLRQGVQSQPLNIFQPAQPAAPQQSTGGAMNMRSLVVLAVLGFVGFWLYKKYA